MANQIRANGRCVVPMAIGVCGATVPEDAPMPLCMAHLASAWEWCRERIATAQTERPAAELVDAFQQRIAAAAEAKAAEREALAADDEVDDADSVIYYLRFGDRIKIGRSRNIVERLKVIPHDELLAVEPGGPVVELRRHRQFRDDRIVREWFTPSRPLLEHIEQVKAAEADRLASVRIAREAFDLLDHNKDRVTQALGLPGAV